MIDKCLKLYKKYEEIINYLIVGVLTTLVSIGTYGLFAKIIGINYLISNIISWVVSVAFAYITNKIFVFKNKEKEKNFKFLVISNEILHILITLCLLIGSLSNRIPNIVWICLFSYYASSIFFRYRTRKLLESES